MLMNPVLGAAKIENNIDMAKNIYLEKRLIFNTFRISCSYLPRQQK